MRSTLAAPRRPRPHGAVLLACLRSAFVRPSPGSRPYFRRRPCGTLGGALCDACIFLLPPRWFTPSPSPSRTLSFSPSLSTPTSRLPRARAARLRSHSPRTLRNLRSLRRLHSLRGLRNFPNRGPRRGLDHKCQLNQHNQRNQRNPLSSVLSTHFLPAERPRLSQLPIFLLLGPAPSGARAPRAPSNSNNSGNSGRRTTGLRASRSRVPSVRCRVS